MKYVYVGLLMALLCRPALADVVIKAQVVTQVDDGVARSRAVTFSYHGDQVRVDTEDGGTAIYDLRARQVYRLDSQHHTYTVAPIGELPPPPGTAAQLSEKLQAADKYDVSASLKAGRLTASVEAVTTPGEGVGAGNVPLPGQGPDLSTSPAGSIPIGVGGYAGGTFQPSAVAVHGDFQFASDVKLPDVNLAVLPMVAASLPENSLTAKLLLPIATQVQGVPRQSTMHVELTRGGSYSADADTVNLEVGMKVVSTTDMPLSRAQFVVPADYEQTWPVQIHITQ
ncbi:MAG: hypothetical protein ACYCW6_03055 [Candidatus Xenobia bacterium]